MAKDSSMKGIPQHISCNIIMLSFSTEIHSIYFNGMNFEGKAPCMYITTVCLGNGIQYFCVENLETLTHYLFFGNNNHHDFAVLFQLHVTFVLLTKFGSGLVAHPMAHEAKTRGNSLHEDVHCHQTNNIKTIHNAHHYGGIPNNRQEIYGISIFFNHR